MENKATNNIGTIIINNAPKEKKKFRFKFLTGTRQDDDVWIAWARSSLSTGGSIVVGPFLLLYQNKTRK